MLQMIRRPSLRYHNGALKDPPAVAAHMLNLTLKLMIRYCAEGSSGVPVCSLVLSSCFYHDAHRLTRSQKRVVPKSYPCSPDKLYKRFMLMFFPARVVQVFVE